MLRNSSGIDSGAITLKPKKIRDPNLVHIEKGEIKIIIDHLADSKECKEHRTPYVIFYYKIMLKKGLLLTKNDKLRLIKMLIRSQQFFDEFVVLRTTLQPLITKLSVFIKIVNVLPKAKITDLCNWHLKNAEMIAEALTRLSMAKGNLLHKTSLKFIYDSPKDAIARANELTQAGIRTREALCEAYFNKHTPKENKPSLASKSRLSTTAKLHMLSIVGKANLIQGLTATKEKKTHKEKKLSKPKSAKWKTASLKHREEKKESKKIKEYKHVKRSSLSLSQTSPSSVSSKSSSSSPSSQREEKESKHSRPSLCLRSSADKT